MSICDPFLRKMNVGMAETEYFWATGCAWSTSHWAKTTLVYFLLKASYLGAIA